MQITIDTKHDSPQEIRKAIKMLNSLVGNTEIYTNETYEEPQNTKNIFEQPSSDMTGMMGIFDTPAEAKEQEKEPDMPTMEFY